MKNIFSRGRLLPLIFPLSQSIVSGMELTTEQRLKDYQRAHANVCKSIAYYERELQYTRTQKEHIRIRQQIVALRLRAARFEREIAALECK
jgi:hypothetical protein